VAPPDPYRDDLRLAMLLADDADSITTDRFGARDLVVESKPDLTPVSDADRAVEESIRRSLARARPRDAVLGEEFGATGWGPRRWIIDPIDGTKNYVRGVPVWATLIALADGDEIVVGVVSAPALGRRWFASKGSGAFAGRTMNTSHEIRVSGVSGLADASLSYSSLSGWEEQGLLERFLDLTRSCWRTRGYGDFWSYVMVAEGVVDAACEPELALHDMAAPSILVTEAGGRFTDLSGAPLLGGDLPVNSAVATNGLLHDAVLDALTG
jgi:histidinol-phosphatase